MTLAGKRILVTRAPHQASRLAEALEAKGAETLLLPTIEIIPPESYDALDAALRSIECFDWLILTSANGVEALAGRLHALAIALPLPERVRVAAIGPATAQAAREAGLPVHVMPKQYVAEAVSEAIGQDAAEKRVLLVRAAVGRDVIPEELGRRGARVQVVEAYRTIVPTASIREATELFDKSRTLPDAATFTSSSTVTHFLRLLRAADLERPAGLRAVSIGPVTSQTLREEGWEPAAEAKHSDIPGLVAACERLFG